MWSGEVSGLSAGRDDAAAQGFLFLDDLVDLVGGPANSVVGYDGDTVGVGDDDVPG